MLKISIIIPIYNVFEYLPSCIESVLRQTYKEWELILVDDGSTDGSDGICDRYGNLDDRIQVIHQKNGGVSNARNRGLAAASGDYFLFLDGDDLIDKGMLDRLAQEAKDGDVDIVISVFDHMFSDGKTKEVFRDSERMELDRFSTLREMFNYRFYGWEPVGKLYKRELFDGVRFDESKKYAEDMLINWELLKRVKRTVYIPYVGYHYYQRKESAVHSKFSFEHLSTLEVVNKIDDEMDDVPTDVKRSFNNIFLRRYRYELSGWIMSKEYELDERFVRYQKRLLEKMNEAIEYIESPKEDFVFLLTPVESIREKMKELKEEMVDEIKRCKEEYDGIYIYGAGDIASNLAEILNEAHIEFDGFVVGRGHNTSQKPDNGIHTVIDLDHFVKEKNCLIIAVSNQYLQEVLEGFRYDGISNYISPEKYNILLN